MTVIALTLTGIIGWFAMKTNKEIVIEEGSESKTQDEINIPDE